MKLYHDCSRPYRQTPPHVDRLWFRWRCPICGQAWSVRVWSNGGAAASPVPLGYPNLRHWRWQRRARKAMLS